MSRREGSPRAHRPVVDVLECRCLLSQLPWPDIAHALAVYAADVARRSPELMDGDLAAAGRIDRAYTSGHPEENARDADEAVVDRGRVVAAHAERATAVAPQTGSGSTQDLSTLALRNAAPVASLHEPSHSNPALTVLAHRGPEAGAGLGQGLSSVPIPPGGESLDSSEAHEPRAAPPGRSSLIGWIAPAPQAPQESTQARELPPPQGSGLVSDVSMFDRAALEDAAHRFFDQLGDLGKSLAPARPSSSPGPQALLWLIALASLEPVRRWLQARRGGRYGIRVRVMDPVSGTGGFSGWPGSWSPRTP